MRRCLRGIPFLITLFCKNGEGLKALAFFCRMVEEGVELIEFTLTSVLNACGLLMEAKLSEQIHGFILKVGFGSNACMEAALPSCAQGVEGWLMLRRCSIKGLSVRVAVQ